MSRLIEDYIEEMFNEKNVSFVNRQKLWEYYNDKLSKGVDVGYSPNIEFYDKELANSLKKNIAQFSAFKETSFRKDLENLMTEGDRFVPWSEFKKEAFKLSGDYNGRWLEAEYNQTVANANMAQKWKEFEQNTDLYPNLKLVTVNDARVRPEHKVLDGVIRPFNDPFWNTHTPPLDWGCRCGIEQTDEEPTDIPGGFQTKLEFENNPGKTGKVFSGSAYEENLSKKEKKEVLENLEKFTKKTIIPDGLESMEKKFGVVVDREFLSNLKENNFVITNDNRKGSAYDNFWKKLNINDHNIKEGDWKRRAIFYHEIGHAIDVQNDLHNNPLVKEIMDKYRKKYSERKNDFYRQFNQRTKFFAKKSLDNGDLDFHQQVLAADDVLMSLNSKFGSGHSKAYFARKTAAEREFLAHCFESKYCGNSFIEKVDKDLHNDMISLIDKLLP
ncbi:phage head morphogenesis protein [Chryseobacterium salviniae]|uniref:Phage minor head protein n=1 Tax=Chryseobacterium salviniae TaxID=3101750 RepID=A0ABU6HV24_9FLAO|nr:phage minor head protein [Chryseobacterium sp. T9W2-O]MEC3875950.1 phage minor head protein [Chryseobacterium sp. T9W2-O]